MKDYVRRVFYYETDQMGIVHHSNYIRWMEEARLDYMIQLGLDYKRIESENIIMPVISVDCKFKVSARYGDDVYIKVTPDLFNGVKACFSYELKNSEGILLAEGNSGHCFLNNTTRKPVNLKKYMPEYCSTFLKQIEKNEEL